MAEIFAAEQVELTLGLDAGGPRLIRGTAWAVIYDGPPSEPDPDADPAPATVALPGRPGAADLGALRLYGAGPVLAAQRGRFVLRAFVTELCAAITSAKELAARDGAAPDATRDPLTGVATRRRLQEYGTQLLAQHPRPGVDAVVLVDLDRFAQINKDLGHDGGDRALVAFA
jgi:diguanylate cyclase